MLLSEVLTYLAQGDLRNLAIGGDGSGVIPEKHQPTIIGHINLALTELHTRFPLKERELTIQQFDHIEFYKLTKEYSATSGTAEHKYIIDTEECPFTDDIIRIETAYNEIGCEVPLNDYTLDTSLFTPAYNVIQIPLPVGTNTSLFIYRANHPLIPVEGTDPTTTEVDLPYTFLEALMFYVAQRVYSNKSGNEGQAMASTYKIKYEAACEFLTQHNAANDSYTISNTKPMMNYWP
ncbi:virion structural protein [Vibrio phage D518]